MFEKIRSIINIMAKIITINSLKGGVSKSTLAINLYYYLVAEGNICGLIDADPQGSLTEELADREDVPLLARDQIEDWQAVKTHAEGDFIVIDTAPTRDPHETLSILGISDFVLIPCKASIFDVRALFKTVGLVKDAQKKNKKLRGAIILTQGKPNTTIHDHLRETVEDYGFPVLAAEMLNRVDYQGSLSEPNGIFSTRNKKAQKEIKSMAIEVKNLLKK